MNFCSYRDIVILSSDHNSIILVFYRGIQNMMCNKVIGKQTQYNTNGILIALPVMSQD